MIKRILLFSITLLSIGSIASAQEEQLKNFRFGLKIAPNFSWMNPDDVKQFTKGNIGVKFNYGLITEFKLTKSASLCTGFDFNSYGGKINYKNTSTRYAVEDMSGKDTSTFYYVGSRSYNIKTYELPLTLKLRTPEIGSLTYFGIFGVNIGARGKVKANDEGMYKYMVRKSPTSIVLDTLIDGASTPRPDNIISKDMAPIRLGLNVGIGAEYNLAGSTSLVVSVNYYNSFINSLKSTSNSLSAISGKTLSSVVQNVKSNSLAINIGFLF